MRPGTFIVSSARKSQIRVLSVIPRFGVASSTKDDLLQAVRPMNTQISKHIGAAFESGIAGGKSVKNKPEWLRVPEAVRLFGLGRSYLYELIGAGSIRSTSIRRRGALRGIRLISYDSLVAYIECGVVEETCSQAPIQ